MPARKVLGDIGKKHKGEQACTGKPALKHVVRSKNMCVLADIAGISDRFRGVVTRVGAGGHSSFSSGVVELPMETGRSWRSHLALCLVSRKNENRSPSFFLFIP